MWRSENIYNLQKRNLSHATKSRQENRRGKVEKKKSQNVLPTKTLLGGSGPTVRRIGGAIYSNRSTDGPGKCE